MWIGNNKQDYYTTVDTERGDKSDQNTAQEDKLRRTYLYQEMRRNNLKFPNTRNLKYKSHSRDVNGS